MLKVCLSYAQFDNSRHILTSYVHESEQDIEETQRMVNHAKNREALKSTIAPELVYCNWVPYHLVPERDLLFLYTNTSECNVTPFTFIPLEAANPGSTLPEARMFTSKSVLTDLVDVECFSKGVPPGSFVYVKQEDASDDELIMPGYYLSIVVGYGKIPSGLKGSLVVNGARSVQVVQSPPQSPGMGKSLAKLVQSQPPSPGMGKSLAKLAMLSKRKLELSRDRDGEHCGAEEKQEEGEKQGGGEEEQPQDREQQRQDTDQQHEEKKQRMCDAK